MLSPLPLVNVKYKIGHSMTMNEQPEIGSVWRHDNGTEYVVVMFTNTLTKNPEKYPVTVVYANSLTQTMWSRPLNDWHRSMTPIDNLGSK